MCLGCALHLTPTPQDSYISTAIYRYTFDMHSARQPGNWPPRNRRPPMLLLLLVAFTLVFAAFFSLQGLRNLSTGLDPASAAATQQAQREITAIAEQNRARFETQTARPTATAIPPCQEFTIRTAMANIRAEPDIDGERLDRLPEGTTICVIQAASANSEWHLIDRNPNTRRIEIGYMHQSVLRAANPTPRPTASATPITLATITPRP